MIVLHYIPSLMKKEGQAARYVQTIHAAMRKTMESHLFTGEVSRREFVSMLCKVNPDIVHIHGCWSLASARVERWSRQRGYPVILSPHGELNDLSKRPDFWKHLMPRIILYQYHLTRSAFVLHASSAAELSELKALGWKRRIALIPYPSETLTAENMVEEFRLLYQKTLDTVRQNRLSVRETKCLWAILSLYADNRDDMDIGTRNSLTSLTAHEWQTILVYSIDHSIEDIVRKTLGKYDIHPTATVTSAPSRYSTKNIAKLSPPPPRLMEAGPQNQTESIEWTMATELYILISLLRKLQSKIICGVTIHVMHNLAALFGILAVMAAVILSPSAIWPSLFQKATLLWTAWIASWKISLYRRAWEIQKMPTKN